MPLIEGIGDEVTALLACLAILIIITVAWMSTRVSATVHTSVVIIDRERFAELLQRVRGVAARSSAALSASFQSSGEPTAATSTPATSTPVSTTSVDDAGADEAVVDSNAGTLPEPMADTGSQSQVGLNAVADSGSEAAPTSSFPSNSTSPLIPHSSTSPHVEFTANQEMRTAVDPDSTTDVSTELEKQVPPAAPDLSQRQPQRESADGSPPDGCVEIRLQFVDGCQRTVFANPDDTIGDFKRCHFARELANNSIVRFIAGGQELRDETSTLRSHRLATSGCVLHCLVTPQRTTPGVPGGRTTARPFDIGILMFPLFGSVLALLWYARVVYRGYFNGTSTFSLLAISFLYIVALLASFRGSDEHAQQQQQQQQQQQHAHVD